MISQHGAREPTLHYHFQLVTVGDDSPAPLFGGYLEVYWKDRMLAIATLFQGLHLQVAKITKLHRSKGVGMPASSISRAGEDERDLRPEGEIRACGPE